MARRLRITDPDLERQAQDADEVYIGEKLFIAVAAVENPEGASLTPAEQEMLRQALADTRPRLKGPAALQYLLERGKSLGLD